MFKSGMLCMALLIAVGGFAGQGVAQDKTGVAPKKGGEMEFDTTSTPNGQAEIIKPRQELPAPVEPAAPSAAAGETATNPEYQKPRTFVPSERLQKMRYRHLWLAYAFVWLFIFLFIFRTWKMNQATTAELDYVRKKLAALEADDGDA